MDDWILDKNGKGTMIGMRKQKSRKTIAWLYMYSLVRLDDVNCN